METEWEKSFSGGRKGLEMQPAATARHRNMRSAETVKKVCCEDHEDFKRLAGYSKTYVKRLRTVFKRYAAMHTELGF